MNFYTVIHDVVLPGIASCFTWFETLMSSMSGSTQILIAVFSIVCVYRFLLAPLFRGAKAGSDRAKHTKNDSSSNKQMDNVEGV